MDWSKDSLPKVGQHAEMEVVGEDNKPYIYATWVQEVTPPRVTVAAPTIDCRTVLLPRGQAVSLRCGDERGMFTLQGVVVDLVAEPPRVTIEVREVSRGQNRNYFRWKASFPVRFVKRADVPGFAGFDALSAQVCRWAQTRDISGGGVLLELRSTLDLGDLIMMEIDLSGQKMEAEGRVVRVTQEERSRGAVHTLAGIEFTRICKGDQDRIIGFIFREQARLRKEGRL